MALRIDNPRRTRCRAADGTELFYVTDGDGPRTPIVLVHGLFCSHRLYDPLVGRLHDRLVIRPDVRGHGRSGRPHDPTAYRWRTMGDDVVDVLDSLGIEQAVIGGLSLGANIALSVAEHHPERCAGLVVEMPVLTESRAYADSLFTRVACVGRALRPLLLAPTALVRRLPPVPGLIGLGVDVARLDVDAMLALERGLLESDEPFPAHDGDWLGELRVPALVIGHRRDGLHALEDARLTSERVPGAELIVTANIADLRLHADRYGEIHNDWLDRHDL